jgi:hypothetical protein
MAKNEKKFDFVRKMIFSVRKPARPPLQTRTKAKSNRPIRVTAMDGTIYFGSIMKINLDQP